MRLALIATTHFLATTLTATAAVAAEPSAVVDVSAALASYKSGDFDAAADGGAAMRTADGHALAAKAWAAIAILDPGRSDAIAAAHREAAAAVALDPAHIEGRLQLAVALWLEGRTVSNWEGFRKGLAQQGRGLIDAVLVDDPNEPWALALSGSWHLEVSRRGGGLGASMLGADIAKGGADCNAAMLADPDEAAIAAQCAVAFAALDAERYRDYVAAAADRALAAPVDDAFEAKMQDRARDLKRALDAGEVSAARTLALGWVSG